MPATQSCNAAEDCIARAAAREVDRELWEHRFHGLFASGLLKLSRTPGCETAMHIRAQPFSAEPEQAAEFCAERWRSAHRNGMQIGIDFSCIEAEDFSIWLERFRKVFDRVRGLPNDGLLLSVSAQHAGAESLLTLRNCAALGNPRVAIRFTAEVVSRASQTKVWRVCVRASCADPEVFLVPSASGRLLSGLHSRERGSCVLPTSLLETSTDTAWLMLDIDATKLGSAVNLRRRLAYILRFADNLIDAIGWARPALQVDALLNRRVGLHLGRLGDLLVAGKFDPGEHATLNRFRRWLNFVRCCVLHESMLLARQRGPFPELGAMELIAELTPRYGSTAAHQLVRNRFLRHRHLLALSPCELFPTGFGAGDTEAWLNLLPALSCADALSIYGPDPRKRLYLPAWSRFLRLSSALHETATV